MTKTINVLCSICREDIPKADFIGGLKVADNHIYKAGELSSIELAHTKCAKESDHSDDWSWNEAPVRKGWEWHPDENHWLFAYKDGAIAIVYEHDTKFYGEVQSGRGPDIYVSSEAKFDTLEEAFDLFEHIA